MVADYQLFGDQDEDNDFYADDQESVFISSPIGVATGAFDKVLGNLRNMVQG